VAEEPAGVTFKALTSPAVTLTRSLPLVTLQVAVPVKFLWLLSSKVPVACNCTVSPTLTRFVDDNVFTAIEVNTGSTKKPWQPTATAASKRTAQDARTRSLRPELDIM